jgi:hypothetical protein
VRTLTALTILTSALALTVALAAPSLARDLTLPKTTADALKAACAKAGGKFSQDDHGYGCGTDCAGGASTDCTVYCTAGQTCTAQVIGARRPRSVADALTKPGRNR